MPQFPYHGEGWEIPGDLHSIYAPGGKGFCGVWRPKILIFKAPAHISSFVMWDLPWVAMRLCWGGHFLGFGDTTFRLFK